jgi:WD40 repeat protein
LVCDEKGSVTLWNLQDPHSPRPLSTFETGAMIYEVDISADGHRLLTSRDFGADLWQLDDQFRAKRIGALQGTDTALLDDSGRVSLMPGSSDRDLHLWDLADPAQPREAGRLTIPSEYSPDYNLSGDGTTAVVATDNRVIVWDVRNIDRPRRLGSVRTPPMGQRSVALARNGRLAIPADDGVYDLSDPRRPRRSGSLKVSPADVDRGGGVVALTPDGGTAIAAVAGQPIGLWDLRDPNHPGRSGAFGRSDEVSAVALSSDGRLALTAGISITVWALRPVSSAQRVGLLKQGADGGLEWAAPTGPDRNAFAIASRSMGRTELWDLTRPTAPRRIARLPGRDEGVTALVTAPDRHIALVSGPSETTLWDVADRARPRRLSSLELGIDGGVHRMGLDRAARIAVVPAVSNVEDKPAGRTTVWDVSRPSDPRRLSELQVPGAVIFGATVSPDGRLVATEISRGDNEPDTVVLWDLSDPTRPRQVVDALRGAAGPVEFAPNGRLLLAGGTESFPYLWDVRDVENVRRLGTMPGLYGGFMAASFSADSGVLLAGGEDQNVTVWDVHHPETPKRLVALTGHINSVYSAVFGAGERTVVSGSASGPTLIWDVSQVMEIAADPGRVACETVGRGLTPEEWSDYVPDLPYRKTC